jgi:hypothetical protein
MGPFLKQHGLTLAISLLGIYLLFFLSLGTHTFAGHMLRIARTPATHSVRQRLRSGASDY